MAIVLFGLNVLSAARSASSRRADFAVGAPSSTTMSLASLGFRAAAAPLGQRWLNKLALAPAPMLLAGLSSGMRGVAPSLQQNRLASRKAKGPGGNSRKPARKEDDDDEIEELDLDAADALPVHARRTRISMEAHLRAAAVAAQPVDVSETGDPLENIQQIISQWGRKKEPAQLWTQYQRLVREGDVASLGLAEFNSLFSIFSEGENVAAEVWEARVVEFAGLLEQAGSAGW